MLLAPAYVVLQWRRGQPWKPRTIDAVAILVGVCLLISFPLRNIILTGNPFYPMGLSPWAIWGDTSQLVRSFDPLTPAAISASALLAQPMETWEILVSKIARQLPVLLILVAGVATFAVIKPKTMVLDRKSVLLLIAGGLAMAIFVAQPFVVENIPGTRNQLASGRSLRFMLAVYVLASAFLIARIPRRFTLAASVGLFIAFLFWNGINAWVLVLAIGAPLMFVAGRLVSRSVRIGALLLIPVFLAGLSATLKTRRPDQVSRAYTYNGRTHLVEWLGSQPCPLVIVAKTSLRAWPLIGPSARNRVVSVGMSRPDDELVQQARLHKAAVVLVAMIDGQDDGLEREPFLPYPERLLSQLGAGWAIGYRDGFVVALVDSARIAECRSDDSQAPRSF